MHTEHNVYQLQSVDKLFKYRDKFAQFVLIIMHKLNCHMQPLSLPQLEQSLFFFFIEHVHGFFLGMVHEPKFKPSYLAYTEQEDHLSLTQIPKPALHMHSFEEWKVHNTHRTPQADNFL
jgi:hypothetical protein